MWNFLVGALLVGGTAVLYDGSPSHPDLDVLWALAERAGTTHLGASAAFLMACRKAGIEPGRRARPGAPALHRLDRVAAARRGVPLGLRRRRLGRLARLDQRRHRRRARAFVGGCPLLPVRAGRAPVPEPRRAGRGVRRGRSVGRSAQTGELVITAPMPSMPVGFWNDPDGARYRESYFEMYPGVWRHGDWIRLTASGGAVIEGRSDSTLNRGGVRFGTSELYGVVDALPEVARQPGHRPGARRRDVLDAAVRRRCGRRRRARRRAHGADRRGDPDRRSRRATSRTRSSPCRPSRGR